MDFNAKFDKLRREPLEDAELQAIVAAFGIKDARAAIPMFGGYSNINYRLTEAGGRTTVLRIFRTKQAFVTEKAVLTALAKTVPVPEILGTCEDVNGYASMRLGFVKGELLCHVEDGLAKKDIAEIGAQLGRILAVIHSRKYTASGFFGEDCTVAEPLDSFFAGYWGYLQSCMQNPLLAERLGSKLHAKLAAYIEETAPVIQGLSDVCALVHSDFNSKNIMVSQINGRWEIAAIMDWEFAFSGSPLVDFGNFFRFESEMPKAYKKPLLEAYRANGGTLPENWQDIAKALDLLSMVQFLTREGFYPKTFATAKGLVRDVVG